MLRGLAAPGRRATGASKGVRAHLAAFAAQPGLEIATPYTVMPQKGCIVGLGDPVMDIVLPVSPEFLSTITQHPGGCLPMDGTEMDTLLQKCTSRLHEPLRVPGGSAANVMKGLANMLAGQQGAEVKFVGMIGSDSTGDEYRQKLAAHGVQPLLQCSESGAPSAISLCLVTPDGQRTMRTCLGASLELQEAASVAQGWAQGCRLLHCEGYCLYRPRLAAEMMRAAKAQGALVSMDLASFELVERCWPQLLALLQEGLLDLVFANEEEALMLWRLVGSSGGSSPPAEAEAEAAIEASSSAAAASASSSSSSSSSSSAAAAAAISPVGAKQQGQQEACNEQGRRSETGIQDSSAANNCCGASPAANGVAAEVHAAQRFLLRHCQISVVSLGAQGCIARGSDGSFGSAPACLVPVKDTIGAGDYFTSGFLLGFLQGASLQQCAVCGCAAGAEAVQAVGAELSPDSYERLRRHVQAAVAANV